jgi:ribosomal protein S18 acetylase RimI-like enzyme
MLCDYLVVRAIRDHPQDFGDMAGEKLTLAQLLPISKACVEPLWRGPRIEEAMIDEAVDAEIERGLGQWNVPDEALLADSDDSQRWVEQRDMVPELACLRNPFDFPNQ